MRNSSKLVAASLAALCAGLGSTFAQTPAAPAPAVPKTWADSITLKGDVRYRYESIEDDSALNSKKETYTRQRDRVRVRLGAEAKANDNLKAGVQWSTGGTDPVSGNETLGSGFQKKDFRLDLGYMDYSVLGDDPTEIHIIGGKMKNPFITMQDDLVWDGDATPEGIALKFQGGNDFATFYVNGGYLWLLERSNKADSMLYVGQAGVKLQFVETVALTLGGAQYSYKNVQGYDVIDWQSANGAYGNSTKAGTVSGTTTNKAWASEFSPFVGFAQVDVWAGTLPIALFSQVLNNGDANGFDKGKMYGITVGKAKNPGTFELGYSYAELDKDATIGFLTDSDRWGGGTDGKGSKIVGKYQIMKNLQVGASYFMDKKTISDASREKDYNRLQIDFLASF